MSELFTVYIQVKNDIVSALDLFYGECSPGDAAVKLRYVILS